MQSHRNRAQETQSGKVHVQKDRTSLRYDPIRAFAPPLQGVHPPSLHGPKQFRGLGLRSRDEPVSSVDHSHAAVTRKATQACQSVCAADRLRQSHREVRLLSRRSASPRSTRRRSNKSRSPAQCRRRRCWQGCEASRLAHCLTVKSRGRPVAPTGRRGRKLSLRVHGAVSPAAHGPLR